MFIRVLFILFLLMPGSCRHPNDSPSNLAVSRMTVVGVVEGLEIGLSKAELEQVIAKRLAAAGVEVLFAVPEPPARESTSPILTVSILTGPQICRRYYPRDTGHCDRVGLDFREPVRLLRQPETIVLAPTITFSEGSDYRNSPEVYAQEMTAERLTQRVNELLDWLLAEGLTGTPAATG